MNERENKTRKQLLKDLERQDNQIELLDDANTEYYHRLTVIKQKELLCRAIIECDPDRLREVTAYILGMRGKRMVNYADIDQMNIEPIRHK